jgi:hypothetical protein
MFSSLDIFKTGGLAVCNEVVGKALNFLQKLCHQLQNMFKEIIFFYKLNFLP